MSPLISGVSRGMRMIWRWAHWLSLDVMVGAWISAQWVGDAWGEPPSDWSLIALASGALWVYSTDHWADAQRIHLERDRSTLSLRRAYYVEARSLLLTLIAITTLTGAFASAQLPPVTLFIGVGCLALCGLYLWIAQRLTFKVSAVPKEAMITALYTLALSLWPLSSWIVTDHPLPLRGTLVTALIATLAWSNLCLISAHERSADLMEGSASIATRLGETRARSLGRRGLTIATGVWCIGGALSLISVPPTRTLTTADLSVSALMISTLWALYATPQWSVTDSRYRRWADLIFLYPILTHCSFSL